MRIRVTWWPQDPQSREMRRRVGVLAVATACINQICAAVALAGVGLWWMAACQLLVMAVLIAAASMLLKDRTP